MNITEYIASGILESYVIGAVSDQERREVDCLSAIYPELRQELDQLNSGIEQYAQIYSIDPPLELKARIMAQLSFDQPKTEPIIRPMPVTYPSVPTYRVTWIVAASLGLIMLFFSFFLLSRLRSNQENMTAIRSTNDSLQSELKQVRDQNTVNQETLALIRQAGTRTLELRGNEKAPNGDVLIFWNTNSRQVAVEVRSLPALPPNQQYQLWSLVDGKPIDAGVFDATEGSQRLQQLNRSIGRADAFAVTVEKRGGSPTPTMSTLLGLLPVKA